MSTENIIGQFEILYDDCEFIAINKPRDILIHRTKMSKDNRFVLQILRDQLGYRIYPVHRLDRGTTGVLVFGKSTEAAELLSQQIRAKAIKKKYIAIVRGFVENEGTINYALTHPKKKMEQDALTHFTLLSHSEMNFAISRYPTSRYSLLEIRTETGRFHQIRRHFAHLRHPVIGDKKHGDCKHNKYFSENLGLSGMMLHAIYFEFLNPLTNLAIKISAPFDEVFEKAMDLLGLVKSKTV